MRFPILLARYRGFDAITNGLLHVDSTDDPELDAKHYFKGVRTMLMNEGYTVRHANVPFADSAWLRERGRLVPRQVRGQSLETE